MLLWIVLALLAGGVVLLLAKTETFGTTNPEEEKSADVNVYVDQLEQIETDRAQGLLSEGEASSARAEVARRLLTTVRQENPSTSLSEKVAGGPSTITRAILLAIPFLSLALYLVLGSPHLPNQPHASRQDPTVNEVQIESLIAKVEARLQEAPDDGTGWDVIAPIYLRLGKYDKALDAYQKATRILGETPSRLAGHIQADILARNGRVSPEARTLCDRLLQLDPQRLEARLWLALAKEQDGQWEEARKDYETLLQNQNLSADLIAVLQDRLQAIEKRDGGKAKASPERQPPATSTEGQTSFSPEERQTIEGMVNRLAARLGTDSQDVEGWTKLMRSYMVLGRQGEAQIALRTARQALAKDPPSLAKLESEASNLGLLNVQEEKKENRMP